ncbi:MAG: ABC transporter ATP-binding protein [Deltaproteobacteria bacterium]|nr:ABC transporter ATP-binding protein [Deltaproteobacteria bacterium]
MKDQDKPLLTIRGLHTYFHTLDGIVNAIDGVDLEVYRGETLGLVGESGCGKTVTALSVLQLLACPPAEIRGIIQFQGVNLLDLGRDGIRKIRGNAISMIFQEPMTSLNPVLIIGEQIAEAVRLHQNLSRQEAWRRAVQMLQMVQIPSPRQRAREYPHKLSGGMRQRAMIAMALSCNPQLLFADEPTTALDVTIQAQILNLMKRLKDEFNTSIVLITHDLGVIAEMATRVIVMYAGQIVEEAPVRDLFKDPRHPYTQGLLGSVPVIGRKERMGRRLQEIPGMVPGPLEMPGGCRFHPRCPRVMDVCRTEEPRETKMGDFRRVKCWLESAASGTISGLR